MPNYFQIKNHKLQKLMVEQPDGGFNFMTNIIINAIRLKIKLVIFEAYYLVIRKSEVDENYFK